MMRWRFLLRWSGDTVVILPISRSVRLLQRQVMRRLSDTTPSNEGVICVSHVRNAGTENVAERGSVKGGVLPRRLGRTTKSVK